jgi:hypothetical protein
MTLDPYTKGKLDRQRGIQTNPYFVQHSLPMYKRMFMPKAIVQDYQALARSQWDLGWLDEDTRIDKLSRDDEIKQAQETFLLEIQQNHERFKWLLRNHLKRKNGYLDFQILGLAHAPLGNQHLDEELFKQWIDQQIKNNNSG